MKLNKIFIVILFSASQLLAQDIGTTEVRVVEGFKPTISEASRLNEKAAFADTIKKVRTQEYAVIATDLKSDYKTRPLKAAKVKADKIAQLYGTKVSVGFGNAWTTKASIVHNSKRSKILSYGIIANHFANKYELPYYTDPDAPHLAIVVYPYQVKNSKNTMHLYGKKMSASHIFMGNLNYDRRTSLFWGENPALPAEENYRNRFAYTKLSFSAISKELAADKLKHHTTFFVSDLNEFSENQIHLSTNLSKTIKDLPFALEIELNDYLNYNNSDYTGEDVKSVQSFHFSPSTSLTKYGIDFDLGIEFHYLSDDTPFEIFPQIRATKELVKDVLLVFGGLRHSEQRHTLKSLSDENPYIHSYGTNQTILGGNVVTQDLKTTDTDELYVAMRNVLGKGEVFEGSVAYGTVQNLAHFVGVANGTYNRFLVDYIDVKQLHVNASYDRKINNIISVKANADYYNWDKEVYYKPNFTCDISTPINLRNKIKVTPSLSYIGKRKTNSSFDSEPVFLPVIVEELPSQFHMNLGVYYNYTKNISAYLQLNNLTNSKQDMWIGYREVGFNGLFGLNYSF
jgi:hypothetical protein